jgi:plastocyanin
VLRRLLLSTAAVAAVVAVSVFVFLPAGVAADNSTLQATLQATVGPGFNISLKDSNGAAVAHLDPGTYTIVVSDQGTAHNFHLSGPNNVNEASSIEDVQTVTWTVTFTDGIYTFNCDAHPGTMKGQFAVGSATLPPPPPPPPPPSGFAKGTKLKARVGPGFSISLKDGAGKAVKKVKGGTKYTIAVADKSRSHNFHLFGPGVNKKTAVGANAKATWKVKFKKGKTYRFVCDPHRTTLKGSFKAA